MKTSELQYVSCSEGNEQKSKMLTIFNEESANRSTKL